VRVIFIGTIFFSIVAFNAKASDCPDFIKEGETYKFTDRGSVNATIAEYDDDSCWVEVKYIGKKAWFNLNTIQTIEPINGKK